MSRQTMVVAPTYTYFMQAGRDGLIKIGQSWNVLSRREVLAVEVRPEELYVLGVLLGKSHERRLQKKLRAHKAHGEWFYPTPEVLAEAAKASPITQQIYGPPRDTYRLMGTYLFLSEEEQADLDLVFDREGRDWRSVSKPGMLRQIIAAMAHRIRVKEEKKARRLTRGPK